MRSGVSHHDRRRAAKRPQGPPISRLAPATAGSDVDGLLTVTRASCHSRVRRLSARQRPLCRGGFDAYAPGGFDAAGDPPPAAAVDVPVGVGDVECPGGVCVGTTVGATVTVGVGTGLVV